MSDITRALRTAQREWLSLLIDAAVRVGPDGIGVVPALATSVTETMDAWIGAATDAVVEERRRVYLAEQVRVRSAIESLVTAEPVDVEAATRLLGIPLTGWHLGCAIGAPPGVAGRAASPGRHRVRVRPGGRKRTDAAIRDERGNGPPLGDHRSSATDTAGGGSPRAGAASRRHRRTTFRNGGIPANVSGSFRCAGAGRPSGANGGISYVDAALAIVLSRDEDALAGSSSTSFEILPATAPK